MKPPPTLVSTRAALDAGDTTVADVVSNSLSAITAWESHIHALLESFGPACQANAAAQDAAGPSDQQPLRGLTIALKDIISTTAGYTTAASKMLDKVSMPYNATVVQRLQKAGAIIIGKANLDEFAMGSSNEYSAFGPTKNPWDTSRVPGGSSGGSAAAVASGEALAALGTDTGGSIRLPASFCNLVGLKPTYGRVSRFGVIAYASSFDQVGPFTRSVQDAALLLQVLAGEDPLDATASDEPVGDYLAACQRDLSGLTIGLPQQFMNDAVDPAVKKIIEQAIVSLQNQGAKVKEVSLSLMAAAVPTYYVLVKSEASSNLARFDGLRYGRPPAASDPEPDGLIAHYERVRGELFGPEVRRSILMGTYALSAGYTDAWYKQASRVRTLIRQEMKEVFKTVDVIAGPVVPEAAFPLGSKTDDPLQMYLVDLFTSLASVAGLPAMSVPAGFVNASLPVGLQLLAPHFREDLLFQVGYAYEQAHDWWKMTPKVPNSL